MEGVGQGEGERGAGLLLWRLVWLLGSVDGLRLAWIRKRIHYIHVHCNVRAQTCVHLGNKQNHTLQVYTVCVCTVYCTCPVHMYMYVPLEEQI